MTYIFFFEADFNGRFINALKKLFKNVLQKYEKA